MMSAIIRILRCQSCQCHGLDLFSFGGLMSSMDVVETLDEGVLWKDVPCPASLAWLKDSVALSRFNLSADGSKVTFMSRPNTLSRVLLKDLLAKHPPRIYLDGGQGVGKSHLLLELVL